MLILQQLETFFVFAANVMDISASSVGTHADLERSLKTKPTSV